ncbi:MAG: glycosyltransferase family 4 protein [Desulfobacterales bacterium]|nr:glycosyltransferase family 4 protein [Desulfobacterales bacterium]
MKVLQVHNRYQYRGGEDAVVETEKRLMEDRGHSVTQYLRYNNEINQYPALKKPGLFFTALWARKTHGQLKKIVKKEQPDVVHFHNTLPLVSPAAYYACRDVPVVQTLHNFRLICPAALLFRNGNICELCPTHSLFRSIYYGCYRGSKVQTAAVAAMLSVHKHMGTWTRKIDAYIALTSFMRDKLITAGFPEQKIFIKPNIPANTLQAPVRGDGGSADGYVLFYGRLSKEKGVMTLVKAWENIPYPLKIAGTGPLEKELKQYIRTRKMEQVELTGFKTGTAMTDLIKNAALIIHPSECFEGFPVTLVETFSAGKPVIVSRVGAMSEIIQNGKTGLKFMPGNVKDLTGKIKWALNHGKEMKKMGAAARIEYEKKYTAETNYQKLMTIYRNAAHQK